MVIEYTYTRLHHDPDLNLFTVLVYDSKSQDFRLTGNELWYSKELAYEKMQILERFFRTKERMSSARTYNFLTD